jgi:hypothetical protein
MVCAKPCERLRAHGGCIAQQRHILAGTVAACIAIVLAFFTFVHPEAQGQRSRDPVLQNADQLIAEGRHVFRFDTFGDESFWGGLLQLHRAIEGASLGGVGSGLSPRMALQSGLKVDVDALPSTVVQAIRRGAADLNSPATTLALLKASLPSAFNALCVIQR